MQLTEGQSDPGTREEPAGGSSTWFWIVAGAGWPAVGLVAVVLSTSGQTSGWGSAFVWVALGFVLLSPLVLRLAVPSGRERPWRLAAEGTVVAVAVVGFVAVLLLAALGVALSGTS